MTPGDVTGDGPQEASPGDEALVADPDDGRDRAAEPGDEAPGHRTGDRSANAAGEASRAGGCDRAADAPDEASGPGTGNHAADRGDEALAPYVPLSAEAPLADTPMWLSHHWPDGYDRCAVVAGRHVCRRCLVMYPVAVAVAVIAGLGPWWPGAWDPWLIVLLPLPAVVEFVADNLGLIRYAPTRQMAVTALGAVAAGAGYLRYLDRPGDPLVWGTVVTYGVACVGASLLGHRRSRLGA